MRNRRSWNWNFVAMAALVMAAGGWVASQNLAAQGPRRGGPRPEFGRRMAEQLNLTEEQQAQIRGFLDEQRTQLRALRDDESLTRAETRERAEAIFEATQMNIQSILSVEQQMKAEELRAQREERMGERREREAGRMLDRLSERLGLTDAQVETLRAYQQESFAAMETLCEATTLTREQKREQGRALMEQMQANIRATLTPEQQTEFDALRERGPRHRRPGRRSRGFRPGAWG